MPNHTPDIPTKQCAKCGAVYPATAEFWYRKKTGKYGMQAKCKSCESERARQQYAKNSEAINARSRQYHANNRDKISEWHRRYYEANYDEIRKNQREYREANLDRERERSRRYYIENKESLRKYRHRWAKDNPDKVRESQQKYVESNLDKYRAYSRNRHARKRNAEGSHTAAEVQEQFKRQKGKCYYCGDKLPKQGWHADHVIPLSRGGSNYISNIVCACANCNQSKNDKRPHEWDGGGGRLL